MIIRTILHEEYRTLDEILDDAIDDENIKINLVPKIGTVVYCTGLFEDPDILACIGAEEGTEVYKLAFHKDLINEKKDFYKRIKRFDLLKELEEIVENVKKEATP